MSGTAKGKKIRSKSWRTNVFIICMLAYPVCQFAVFWIGTNLGAILMSFQKFDWDTGNVRMVGTGKLRPGFPRNKRESDGEKGGNQFAVIYARDVFYLAPLSVLFSYFLYKKMPLAGAFRVIFFLPSIVPVVVLTKSFTYVFDSSIGPVDHLLRYVLGFDTPAWFREYPVSQVMIFVYCIWAGLGYNIILLSGAISRLPQEVMEYGRLEGVSMTKELFTIVIPLIWPTITTTFLLGCTSVFTVMLQPLMLTGGEPNTCTIALLIYNAVGGREQSYMTSFGLVLSLIGVPVIMLIRWGLGKIFEDAEF